MGSLLKFLSMVEVFFRLGVKVDIFFIRHSRMVAIVQLERRVVRTCILDVDICKLSYQ